MTEKRFMPSPSSPFGLFRAGFALRSCAAAPRVARRAKRGGARRDRTADLLHAMQALSQLSYGPLTLSFQHDLRANASALVPRENRLPLFRIMLPGASTG